MPPGLLGYHPFPWAIVRTDWAMRECELPSSWGDEEPSIVELGFSLDPTICAEKLVWQPGYNGKE